MITKIKRMMFDKPFVKITKEEREEVTRDFIDVANLLQDKIQKEYTVKFVKAVGLGKPARNTSKT